MKPTNTSNNKNGNEASIGTKKAIIKSKTSPAKILPKSLKEKEIIFENSETISRIPVKKLIGLAKFINLLI